MLALTGGQELIFAIVTAVAVVAFVVLPTCRRYSNREPGHSNRRLMKELKRHD